MVLYCLLQKTYDLRISAIPLERCLVPTFAVRTLSTFFRKSQQTPTPNTTGVRYCAASYTYRTSHFVGECQCCIGNNSRRLISHYGRRPSYNRLTNCVAVHLYGISSAIKSTSRFFRGCFKNSGTENSHTEILVSLIHGNRTSDEEQTCTQVTL